MNNENRFLEGTPGELETQLQGYLDEGWHTHGAMVHTKSVTRRVGIDETKTKYFGILVRRGPTYAEKVKIQTAEIKRYKDALKSIVDMKAPAIGIATKALEGEA